MITVSQLARSCGLSRSTILYYESLGLLKRAPRTAGNYRAYSDQDLARLRQICAYRDAGLTLEDIRLLLDGKRDSDAAVILKRRLLELDTAIAELRDHQRAILKLLGARKSLSRTEMITKEKWTSIMSSAGFSEADMHRWHAQFEKSAPQEHQEFLEFLHIPAKEIETIRDWSRKQKQ